MAADTNFVWSDKSIDFFLTPSTFDLLEGTARSSKSTSAMFKLGLMIERSRYNQFFIAGSTAVVARRNLIDGENGFLQQWGGQVREGTNPRYGNHLFFVDSRGMQKIIYIFGFKDKARWKTVLGSTLGGGVIDEINIADEDFINEIYRAMVSVDKFWLCGTLNPDNPDKFIYNRLINKSRPLKKYINDIPSAILMQLAKEKPIPNAVYWHFNFNDNPAMTSEKVERFKRMYPADSFYYASKILGLRGVVEGVIFGKYLNDTFLSKNINEFIDGRKQDIDEVLFDLKNARHIKYTIGVDLGSNQGNKKGTIMHFAGMRLGYSGVDFIDVHPVNSVEANDMVIEICNKIQDWYYMIARPSAFDEVYIDGYGAVGVLMPTIRKRLMDIGIKVPVRLSVKFGNISQQKKTSDNTDLGDRHSRMMLLLLLINQKKLRFRNTPQLRKTIDHLKTLVYASDGLPLDDNQMAMDYYDSLCYCITPFTSKLNENIIGTNL